MSEDERYDVVVIGGGAAGLSAGVALARACRSVLVVDAGEPRNAPAGHVHNYLGREGSTPADLLADGRAAVTGYGGRVVPGTVVAVERVAGEEPAFRIALADGNQVAARRLLVATGLVDELPDVPGVAERWGIDVLHCPYCHGWEARNQAIGILGDGPMAVHQALMWRQLSEDVTLFLHRAPKPSDDEREQLAARGIPVVEGGGAALGVSGNRLTGGRLVSGGGVARPAGGVGRGGLGGGGGGRAGVGGHGGAVDPCRGGGAPAPSPGGAPRRAALARAPGPGGAAASVAGGAPPADPAGATAIPGVWVAGNV